MLIKIIKNGVESEWLQITKSKHRALLEDRPEEVILRIEDLYAESPDAGLLIRLDFTIFNVIAREFVLEENRQVKRDERHRVKQPLEDIDERYTHQLYSPVEKDYIAKAEQVELQQALQQLTPMQRRRFLLHTEYGLSLRAIAKAEGVEYASVQESVRSAKNKLKKLLGHPLSNGDFLSD